MLQVITNQAYRLFLTILSPSYCAHCKKTIQYDSVFCLQCKSTIFPVISITRQITKKHAVKIFSVSGYKDPLKQLIRAKNWSDISASKQLGNLVWDMTNIKYVDFDVIVPIPLHWTRFANRGFNQAQEIAQVLQNKSDKKVIVLLKRDKKTVYQAQLTHHQRYENVKNVFTTSAENNNK